MLAYDAYSWLREWVATLLSHISCLLMIPILGSSESKCLLCAIFHACSWCLFLALQDVSAYFAFPYFMLAHDACSWASVCEWLLCLAILYACSEGLFWFFSLWVPTLPCHISCLLMMHVPGSPVLRYCRNVRPTWVKFNSKDTKESEWCSRFWVLSPRRGLR